MIIKNIPLMVLDYPQMQYQFKSQDWWLLQ